MAKRRGPIIISDTGAAPTDGYSAQTADCPPWCVKHWEEPGTGEQYHYSRSIQTPMGDVQLSEVSDRKGAITEPTSLSCGNHHWARRGAHAAVKVSFGSQSSRSFRKLGPPRQVLAP